MEKNKINNTNFKYFKDTIEVSEIEFSKKEEVINEQDDIENAELTELNKLHGLIKDYDDTAYTNQHSDLTQQQNILPGDSKTEVVLKNNNNYYNIEKTETNNNEPDNGIINTSINNNKTNLYKIKYDDSYTELDINGNKKQRIKQINFYKPDGNLSYFEIFNYSNNNTSLSEEQSISKLYHGPENKVTNYNLIVKTN